MPTSQSSRRQRPTRTHAAAFSAPLISTFVSRTTFPAHRSAPPEPPRLATFPRRGLYIIEAAVKVRPNTKSPSRTTPTPGSVLASPPSRKYPPMQSRRSRYIQAVPEAKPHEIMPCRRGRNSRRRARDAEHFRKYIHLRRQLKPWSDKFRQEHGRTPSLIDVHASDIPGLLDRFVEYLDALDGLRLEISKADSKQKTSA